MKPTTLSLIALAALGLSSCVGPSVRAERAAPAESNAARNDSKGDSKSDEAAQRKKQRDFAYAQLALESAKLDAENDLRSGERGVAAAERELEAAERELDHFQKNVKALEVDERALAVERSKQNVVEAAEELAELEAMYAQEDFAKTTKELVMTRGRTRLEMSRRDLALAERRARFLVEFEHAKRAREFEERVTKARNALEEARARLTKQKLDKRLSLLKSEHALEDAQRALDEAKPAAQPGA